MFGLAARMAAEDPEGYQALYNQMPEPADHNAADESSAAAATDEE